MAERRTRFSSRSSSSNTRMGLGGTTWGPSVDTDSELETVSSIESLEATCVHCVTRILRSQRNLLLGRAFRGRQGRPVRHGRDGGPAIGEGSWQAPAAG